MNVVRIFDTTLRDGEQSPGFSMKTDEKIRMARQLARLGVDTIEAGFPISSRGDLEAVQAVAREVRDVPIAALARAEGERLTLKGMILTPDGAHIYETTREGSIAEAARLGKDAAWELLERGGKDVLRQAS